MSFFKKSDGTIAEAMDSVEVGGRQPVMPRGTKLESAVVEAKWIEATDEPDYVQLLLQVTEAGKYRGFVVKHKLRIKHPDKMDKHLDMLASYDAKGTGLLMQADKAGKELTDLLLGRALKGVQVIATYDVVNQKNEETGLEEPFMNWVRAIAPMPKRVQAQNRKTVAQAKHAAEEMDFDDDDSDIAF